jgi:type IV pilus assembly protein PilO
MIDLRQKKFLIFAGLAILLLADAAFAYLGTKISAARLDPQQTLAAQTRQLQLMKADVKHASEIRAKIPQVLSDFDRFEAALPPSTNGYSTIDQELTEFAKDTNLQIGERKFHEKELVGRGLYEIEIEATVTGDYAGIVRFLNHLQRSKNTYVISALHLDSASPGTGAPGSLRVALKMVTYFRKV